MNSLKNLVAMGIRIVRRGWLGLLGQGFTFFALMAPLLWGRHRELSFLIVASAGSLILSYTANLAFNSVFPRIEPDAEMATSLRTSLMSLLGVATVVALVGMLVELGGHSSGAYVIGSAGMGLAQGTYLMSMGVAIRSSNYAAVSAGRLVYGISVAALTAAACMVDGPAWILVVANSSAYVISAGSIVFHVRGFLSPLLRLSKGERSSARAYLSATLEAGLSQGLNGLSSQLGVMILPSLGFTQKPWTAQLRLTGGIGTVSQQLVAPAMDIQVAAAAREGDGPSLRRVVRRELVIGFLLAFAAIVLTFAYFAVSSVLRHTNHRIVIETLVYTFVYAVATLGVSVMYNSLILLGGDRLRLGWAGAKSVVMLAVVLFGGAARLPLTVAVEVLSDIAYYLLVRRLVRGVSQAPIDAMPYVPRRVLSETNIHPGSPEAMPGVVTGNDSDVLDLLRGDGLPGTRLAD